MPQKNITGASENRINWKNVNSLFLPTKKLLCEKMGKWQKSEASRIWTGNLQEFHFLESDALPLRHRSNGIILVFIDPYILKHKR